MLVFYSKELWRWRVHIRSTCFSMVVKSTPCIVKFIALWNCDYFSFPSSNSPPSPPPKNIHSINSVQPSFCGWMVPLSVWAWLQTAEYCQVATGCVRQHTYCRTPWGVPDCLWSTCLNDSGSGWCIASVLVPLADALPHLACNGNNQKPDFVERWMWPFQRTQADSIISV